MLKTGYQFFGALSLGLLMGWISKILVSRPHLHDFSVILLLFTSLSENDDPVIDATYSSFWSWTDKKIGNMINKKIIKQPNKIVKDVFIFINGIVKLYV